MPQPLNAKESSLFRSLVKNYEQKLYKKGIKSADQLLRKQPRHGDTQAMKALILNALGQSDEALPLAKVALTNDMKSAICWHVYGLLHRSQRNYEEAKQAFKCALKIEESQNILRDLAQVQVQTRDFPGYVQSRTIMLKERPQLRLNWTALAVAHHLAGNYDEAVRVLQMYEDTLKSPPPKADLEHSEACLYKNTVIAESGNTERALQHLEQIAADNLDQTAVMEMRAKYLSQLDKKEDAAQAYRALLDRNTECRAYYQGLEQNLDLNRSEDASLQKLADLYESYAKEDELVDAARRIPLDFLTGEQFDAAADHYLRRMLSRGFPSTFANIKALYGDISKRNAIEKLVLGYARGSEMNGSATKEADADVTKRFEENVNYFLAQHYNYRLSRDLQTAEKYIDQALETSPEDVTYHLTKARIWKHRGNLSKAADIMDHARRLDEKDRYINTKCALYQLRNNQTDAALVTASKFTQNKAAGGPLGDLHEMQCMWYLLEDGKAYERRGALGVTLKRFHAVADIFEVWEDDQADFHAFSLRKGQIRAYVDMLRWEDALRSHPFFAEAAISAVRIYIRLVEDPRLAEASIAQANGDAASAKTTRKKAKREAERAEAEKKAALAKKGKPSTDEQHKKVDPDPKGTKFLQAQRPLEASMRFLRPLLEFSPGNFEGQTLGFEVYLRKEKYLLAAKCLLAAHALNPDHPKIHEIGVRLRRAVDCAKDLPSSVAEVLSKTFTLIPAGKDLVAYNAEWQQAHEESPSHVLSALRTQHFLDPSTKTSNEQKLQHLLGSPSITMELAQTGLGILDEWNSDEKTKAAYRNAAAAKWPDATVFSAA